MRTKKKQAKTFIECCLVNILVTILFYGTQPFLVPLLLIRFLLANKSLCSLQVKWSIKFYPPPDNVSGDGPNKTETWKRFSFHFSVVVEPILFKTKGVATIWENSSAWQIKVPRIVILWGKIGFGSLGYWWFVFYHVHVVFFSIVMWALLN